MTERRLTILLAEDNPGDVFLVRRALEKQGFLFDLLVVEDGQAALHFLDLADADDTVARPDLALLDLNLPRATGSRVLLRLRQSLSCNKIPVVVVTSSDSPLDREAAEKLGADYYFQKPGDLAGFMQLGGIVRRLLDGGKPLQKTSSSSAGT